MCCIGLTETREVAGRRLRKGCRQEERVGGQARLLDAARRSHRMRTFLQPTARCFWGGLEWDCVCSSCRWAIGTCQVCYQC